MKKTSVYLDPDVDRALARRAKSEGITKAEFVRRVLAEAASGRRRARPSVGLFDGPEDLGAATDRHLADTGFGER